MAENKDGTVSVDMRYNTLIEKVKKDIIKEVGSKLFAV
jgi:vacuolar-type H+-ATPase subunit E/Vma4